ncbi:MAG: tetratricopeptide repeat protein [Spirochaetales bacterium]|nr:tetratricopeptide repeat protein [Spirochaetales bacterium]MCF7937516.1 tetratricopeptide repeat protein [Spirochaetales bacterium]
MKIKTILLPLFLVILFLPAAVAAGQEEGSLDSLIQSAHEAETAERYERAVELLHEAQRRFPEAPISYTELGSLYMNQELYHPALEEYLAAEELAPEDRDILHQIATAYGMLNEEGQAISYLERLHRLYPDDRMVIGDLGWMYFKTHRLEDGEELLLDAAERLGPDKSFSMTLGTIYSDMYEYEKSKEAYLDSIKLAEQEGYSYFASVAYYNLSLLEHDFYHFNNALEYTNRSIDLSDRASGHIARGELYQNRQDFQRALSEYRTAYDLDSTPLAQINLAILFQQFGMLEQALANVKDVLESGDLSWMYYYGTDARRHYMGLHEILEKVYRGKAEIARSRPKKGITDFFQSLWNRLRFRILSGYHRRRFQAYSLEVGNEYLEEGNALNAYWAFYEANRDYRQVALKYLSMAREEEVPLIPEALPYYQQEEGRITGDTALLQSSLEGFHPIWEKEGRARSLRLFYPQLRGNGRTERAREVAVALYRLNPGALRQYGITLPVRFSSEAAGEDAAGSDMAAVIRKLRRSGLESSKESPLQLDLRLDSEGVDYRLSDRKGGVLSRGEVPFEKGGEPGAAEQAEVILQSIFSP